MHDALFRNIYFLLRKEGRRRSERARRPARARARASERAVRAAVEPPCEQVAVRGGSRRLIERSLHFAAAVAIVQCLGTDPNWTPVDWSVASEACAAVYTLQRRLGAFLGIESALV